MGRLRRSAPRKSRRRRGSARKGAVVAAARKESAKDVARDVANLGAPPLGELAT